MNSPRRGEVPDLARERLGVAVEREAGDLHAHHGEDDDQGQDGHELVVRHHLQIKAGSGS